MDSTLRVIQPPSGDPHHGFHPGDPLSAVIIGMGPAGLGAALSLTALGFRVHVIERDTLLDAGTDSAPTPSQVRRLASSTQHVRVKCQCRTCPSYMRRLKSGCQACLHWA